MRRVSIDEVFPLFHSCFPDVKKSSLVECQEWMFFYMLGNEAFCCIYPCRCGLIIQYLGVAVSSRGKGIYKKVISEIKSMHPELDLYGECVPGGQMYWTLLRHGWKRVPINYACPAWGDELADDNLDLLVLAQGNKPSDILGFLTEFYCCGFNGGVTELLRRYKRELDRW